MLLRVHLRIDFLVVDHVLKYVLPVNTEISLLGHVLAHVQLQIGAYKVIIENVCRCVRVVLGQELHRELVSIQLYSVIQIMLMIMLDSVWYQLAVLLVLGQILARTAVLLIALMEHTEILTIKNATLDAQALTSQTPVSTYVFLHV